MVNSNPEEYVLDKMCRLGLLLQTAAFGHPGLSSGLRNDANYLIFFPKALPHVSLIDFLFQVVNEKKAKEYLKRILIFLLAFPQNDTG